MRHTRKLFIAAGYGLALGFSAAAGAADTQAIAAALKQALPGIAPDSIQPSPVKGLFEVVVGPKLFYVSEDGRYLIQGSLIDAKERKDLTEARLTGLA